MWHSRHTHKAWLPLRSSLSALRPHPQLPLWSVMGLLRSASSILITGQNPFNGIWFARKGRGRAVSHWTRLSLETSTLPHPHPLHSPFQVEAWHAILPCPVCVYMWVCVFGRGCTDWEEAEQQCHQRRCLWLIGARAPACSVVLTGSRDGSATCSAAEIARKWIPSCAAAVLNSPMPRDGLSSQLERRGVHWGKVWWSLNFDSVKPQSVITDIQIYQLGQN